MATSQDLSATELDPPVAQEAPASPEDQPQPPVNKSRSRLPLIVVGLIACVAAAGGIGFWLTSGKSPQQASQDAEKPIPPEPPSPPAPFKGTLAIGGPVSESSKSDAALTQATEKISTIASQLPPELLLASVDGVAPARLIVSGSQQRTIDAISRIPRHERWEIRIAPGNTADSYTRQLDFFKMEIGVIGQASDIVYLSNLSAPTPTAKTQSAAGETRLYLIWQRGSMREADEEILARAKIPSAGKVVVHFCPAELENELVKLEDEQAKQAGLKRIRKTVFGIRPKEPEGYRFFVIEQKADE